LLFFAFPILVGYAGGALTVHRHGDGSHPHVHLALAAGFALAGEDAVAEESLPFARNGDSVEDLFSSSTSLAGAPSTPRWSAARSSGGETHAHVRAALYFEPAASCGWHGPCLGVLRIIPRHGERAATEAYSASAPSRAPPGKGFSLFS